MTGHRKAKRGRPLDGKKPTTNAERRAAYIKRQRILRETLANAGITPRQLFVDDRLFARFEAIAAESNYNVHELIFAAMRNFLECHDERDYSDHLFLLEAALISARLRMRDEAKRPLRGIDSV